MNHRCDVPEGDLGPYLLGHLDPDRAAEVGRLVAMCPSCTDEVARLRRVVLAMAAGSPPPEMTATAPAGPAAGAVPAAGLQHVLAAIADERRARRPGKRILALAVAAAVATIVALTAALLPSMDSGREVTLARAAASPNEAAASMRLDDKPWGTAILLQASGLRPGQTYGVWIERREGGRLPAGSFVPDDGGTVRLDLSSGLDLDDSGAVGIALLPGGRTTDAVDVLSARLDG